MKTILARLWKEEEGQDLTEYALLLVLVALAAIGSLSRSRQRSTPFSLAPQQLEHYYVIRAAKLRATSQEEHKSLLEKASNSLWLLCASGIVRAARND